CNCSDHESSEGGARMPVTIAGPAMRPVVPLSRMVRIEEEGAEDQPTSSAVLPPGVGPFPPLIRCKLDFREGCYRIKFKPTASPESFEGTLRVDRSAPDGGADHLIVSGDLYSHLPVIGPVGPIAPLPPPAPADADEGGEPVESASMSVAAALSTV